MTSKTTMRREVRKAGGYYARAEGRHIPAGWCLPVVSHNCAPGSVRGVQRVSLETAYAMLPDYCEEAEATMEFGRREAAYLRRH